MQTSVTNTSRYPIEKNKVLENNARVSDNFYGSDKIFANYLKKNVSVDGINRMNSSLDWIGKEAATTMNELSLLADKYSPELIKRNSYGETINEIRFHPAYWSLMNTAVKSEMFHIKWEPASKEKFKKEKHHLGFSTGYLYAMSECGQYCPLCMTDGVARLIDLFCEEEDKNRLLSHIYTNNVDEFYTGAMFLTEKTGGSDVGANIVTATHQEEKNYLLSGEKWFCSNANADIIFALARTDESVKGTRGLSIFLIEKSLLKENHLDIIRIKDKLGVRSMASAECMLNNTPAKLVGKEFGGFKVMLEMITLSRLYNSVAALAAARRALIEAYQFLCYRKTFDKPAIEHALVRTKLTELGSLHVANFYLVWRAIKALDNADNGNDKETHLLRLINPMTKKWSAETGVYITRESMELMGGLGYIEDTVMPKLMRDVMVLPIWEGSGNIIILDMLRAILKTKGFEIICEEINNSAKNNSDYGAWMMEELKKLIDFAEKLKHLSQDKMETSAKVFFEKLTSIYQISLLIDNLNDESKAWIYPALNFLKEKYHPTELKETQALSVNEVKGLIAWQF